MPAQRNEELDQEGIGRCFLEKRIAEIFLHNVQQKRLEHAVKPFIRILADDGAGAEQMQTGGKAVQHMELGAVKLQNDPVAVGRSKQLVQLPGGNHQNVARLQDMLGAVHNGFIPILQRHNNFCGSMPMDWIILGLLVQIQADAEALLIGHGFMGAVENFNHEYIHPFKGEIK
ncbi:hypothetical protein D3C81_1764140 [compost metagenome]